MGVFNSIYVLGPINKTVAYAVSSGELDGIMYYYECIGWSAEQS